MRIVPIIAVAMISAIPAAQSSSLACDAEWKAESAEMDARRQKLPALFEICASLGVAKNECDEWKIMGRGRHQTNSSLWYAGSASSPDNTPSVGCYQAVAIARYGFIGGGTGTTYACKVKPEDDQITEQEIELLRGWAHRSNSIAPKTLEDHEKAMQVKRLIAYFSEHP